MGGRYQTVRREVVDAVQTKSGGVLAKSMSNPESSSQKKRHQRVFDVKRLVSFGGRQRSGIKSVVCTQRLHLSSRTVLATFSDYCYRGVSLHLHVYSEGLHRVLHGPHA